MKNDYETDNQRKSRNAVSTAKKDKGWIYTAVSGVTLLLIAAIIVITLAASGAFKRNTVGTDKPNTSSSPTPTGSSPKPSTSGTDTPTTGDTPSVGQVVYVNPCDTVTVVNTHGFYFNNTLNCYYEHTGVDIAAEAGDKVYAVASGTVVEVLEEDPLSGGVVCLDLGEGKTASYLYITPASALKVGDKVVKGQEIGTVMEPTGTEYKTGAHLHFEMTVNGTNTDPTEFLTLNEK